MPGEQMSGGQPPSGYTTLRAGAGRRGARVNVNFRQAPNDFSRRNEASWPAATDGASHRAAVSSLSSV